MPLTTHAVQASVFVAGAWSPLAVESCTVTVDTTWQPYVQVSLTCAATSAAIDPRSGQIVQVILSETGGTTVSALELSLRSLAVDETASTYTLRASSAESVVQDKAYVASSSPLGPSVWAGIREGVEDLLITFLGVPSGKVDCTALPYGTSPTLAAGMYFLPGDPWWPQLQDLPTRIGWELYCGMDGIWRVAESVPTPSASVASLALGRDLETYRLDLSRDGNEWADTTACVYSWTDAGGAHRIIGTATVGGPTKVLRTDESFLVTQVQADARAARLVQLARRRGATYQVTVPARYDLRARTFIDLVSRSGAVTKVWVTRVNWSLPDATLTLTAREV